MDGGSRMLKHLRRLTIVFALLGDSPYAVANIHNLRVLLYHAKERRLPFHKMLVNDVGLFSEEAGEISFSCLGRSELARRQLTQLGLEEHGDDLDLVALD